jgi:hypothetical protein
MKSKKRKPATRSRKWFWNFIDDHKNTYGLPTALAAAQVIILLDIRDLLLQISRQRPLVKAPKVHPS